MRSNAYEEARKRVKKKKEFYSHLTSYLVMGVFFFVFNLLTAPGHWWFYWPMLGWGIGVAFHYFEVFGLPGVGDLSKEWEQKTMREEMRRIEREQGGDNLPDDEGLDLEEMHPEKEKRKNWDDSELV